MFQRSFKWVSRVLERSSKKISGKLQRCFKDVPGCSCEIEGFSHRLLSGFQGCFKGVSRKFLGRLRKNDGVFRGTLFFNFHS